MAYIGQGIDRFSNVEKLDAITPATATGAGPYNLLKSGVAFIPSSADTMVVSIDGVIQYGKLFSKWFYNLHLMQLYQIQTLVILFITWVQVYYQLLLMVLLVQVN